VRSIARVVLASLGLGNMVTFFTSSTICASQDLWSRGVYGLAYWCLAHLRSESIAHASRPAKSSAMILDSVKVHIGLLSNEKPLLAIIDVSTQRRKSIQAQVLAFVPASVRKRPDGRQRSIPNTASSEVRNSAMQSFVDRSISTIGRVGLRLCCEGREPKVNSHVRHCG